MSAVTTPSGPNSPLRLMGVDEHGHDVYRLHQYLIGLRRRHPWLHTARTSAEKLSNTQYVFRTSAGGDALLVALNVDDAPMSLSLQEFGWNDGRIAAGSGAPAQDVISTARDRAARLADRRPCLTLRTVAPASRSLPRRRRTSPAPRRTRHCHRRRGRTASSMTATSCRRASRRSPRPCGRRWSRPAAVHSRRRGPSNSWAR